MSNPLSIAEIHRNEELRQHEFPVTKNKVFLAHAAVCPLPRRVADAIARSGDEWRIVGLIDTRRRAGCEEWLQ